MKTIEIKLYKFSELSDEAKQKALEKLYDINVDYDWWEFILEDAKEIGLEITDFEIDRYANGKFIFSASDVAKAIISNHGETCETHKTAKNFLDEITPLYEKDENLDERDYDLESEISDMEEEFLNSLLEDYRIILSNEYEYLTSEEAIKETIEANDYDFTENGKLY